jgi:hypothetical protein
VSTPWAVPTDFQPEDFPLYDRRWKSLAAIHAQLCERTGDPPDLTVLHLDDAVRTEVHAQRRWFTPTPGARPRGWSALNPELDLERERLAFEFWKDYQPVWDPWGKCLRVLPRRGGQRAEARGQVFYVWEPDCKKIWPELWPEPAHRGEIGGRSGGDRGVTIGWQEHTRRKLRAIPLNERQQLHKSKQLRRRIERELDADGVTVPNDPKELLAIIREFL